MALLDGGWRLHKSKRKKKKRMRTKTTWLKDFSGPAIMQQAQYTIFFSHSLRFLFFFIIFFIKKITAIRLEVANSNVNDKKKLLGKEKKFKVVDSTFIYGCIFLYDCNHPTCMH